MQTLGSNNQTNTDNNNSKNFTVFSCLFILNLFTDKLILHASFEHFIDYITSFEFVTYLIRSIAFGAIGLFFKIIYDFLTKKWFAEKEVKDE